MIKRKTLHTLIIVLSDLVGIVLCIILAFYTRSGLEKPLSLIPLGHGISLYLFDKFWIPVITVLCISYYGSYRSIMTVWDELPTFLKGLSVSFLVVWVILSLQKEAETVSRIIITLCFIYMMALLPLLRFLVKYILFKALNQRRPAYLVERRKGDRARVLGDSLNKEWYSGYVIVGNLYMDALDGKIDTCFVPMEYTDESTIKALKHNVENMIIVSSISGLSFMSTEIRTFLTKNLVMITTNNGLLSMKRVMFKRALDIVMSGAALLLFSPFFIIIPILIKMDSKGSVFFVHRRCGMNLAEFGMIKYRTMRSDSDGLIEEFVKNDVEALAELKERNKLKNDPRITRFGKILRKASLDELPQFLNVIKGDMSIVGPRPDMMNALQGFMDSYEVIYSRVRPGITGLWQVSGRSDIKYDERVKLDYLYVLNWSIWLDLVIILKTFRALLGGKGAY
jgi:exopolysaccharide biosynthesis polyprenyl glycosylphosphotransferase